MKKPKKSQNSWHVAFGEVLESLFPPLNIEVLTEVQVMSKSPQLDVLLFQREQTTWTTEQLKRLPDGIRQCKAPQILIEFKFTESVDENGFSQACSYDHFYKQSQQLTDKQAQTFIISAKKPWQKTRKTWGYEKMIYPGVYQSDNECLKKVQLISLNELSTEPHNAYFKLFASQKKERERAFKMLDREGLPKMPEPLESLLSGLRMLKGEQEMKREITPEEVRSLGRSWEQRFLSRLSVEERLAGVPLSERLAGIPLEERLAGTSPSEVMSHFRLEDRLASIPAEERMAGLSVEEIEAYLKTAKKSKRK